VLGAVMLVSPWLIGFGLPQATNYLQVFTAYFIFLLAILVFWEPIRARSNFLITAFAAIDRPEDRPHTLTWLTTSYVAGTIVTLAMAWWLLAAHPSLAFAVMCSVVVGDLLAGAVGYRFGRTRFSTKGLFTSKRYTRSLQGSACIVLVTGLIVFFTCASLPLNQFLAALICLPIGLALAEAKSPHTWDEPIMTVAGLLISLGIVAAVH
jgi:phytol kinase